MKTITFCLLFFLAMLQAQGQVLIGNGTIQQNLPFNPYYGYCYSQTIYTAAEINATGQITSLSWYYGGPAGNTMPNSQGLQVFMGHTTKTEFANGGDWEVAANLTEVYAGGITVNGPGWTTITFTTPFTYNGTDNLVVATAEMQPQYDSSSDFFVSHEVSNNKSLNYQNDGTPPNLAVPQNGNASAFRPNVILGITSTCPTPFFLNTAMTTDDMAVVVWANQAPGPDGTSQYYLSETNTDPTPTTDPTGNSTSMAMLEDLDADTLYYIWVRNVCGTSVGNWSYPTSFRTECSAAASFVENFDTTPVNTLPACWGAIVRGPGVSTSTIVTTFEGEAFTGANSVRLFNGTTGNSADIILVSPKLGNLDTNTHRLRFYADANNNNELVIGTLNNASGTATFTPLPTGSTIAITTSYAEYTVDFSSYTGTDRYIGFKLNSTTNYNPVSLDNIRWEPIPQCPNVTNVGVEDIQPETAVVSWSASGATGFEIVHDLVTGTTDPASLTPEQVTAPSFELTGLTADSRYNVWVRSTCDAGVGAWIGPINFKSACYPVAAFNENFDTTTYPNLPACWTSFIRGAEGVTSAAISVTASNGVSAPNSVILTPGAYVTLDTANDVILVSPNLSTVGTGTHRVKFSAKGGGNLQVGTMDGTTATATFTALDDIVVENSYMEYTVDFTSYTGTDTYFGFRINHAGTYSYTYIDNVIWETAPLCADVALVTVQSVSPDSATLHWEGSGLESGYEIVYGDPATTDPMTLTTIVPADTTTKEVTGLDDATSYAAWVRSVCGTDKGAWIGPVFFKTDCLSATALNENFDTTETNSLPACWTSIVRGTTGTAFAKVNGSFVHSPTKSVQLYNQNQVSTSDVILVSPNLANLGAGTHRLRFYSSYHYASSIQVGTLDTNTNTAVFTVIENISLTSTFTEYTVDFTSWGGITDTYIGIRLSHEGVNSYAHIDDVVWEVAPLCPSVQSIALTDITTDAAFVTWEMGTLPADAWQVAHAPATITDPAAATISNALTVQEYTLESLTNDTAYHVWVRSVCADNDGEWVGPVAFRSKCVSGNAFAENFDDTPNTQLPACWSKIIRGNSAAQHFAYVNNSSIGANSAPNSIALFNSTFSSGNDIILVSPPLDNLAAGTHQLRFFLKGNTANIQVGTLNDNTNTAIFTALTSVTATPTYTEYTIDFADYEGFDVYIGIRHGGVGNTAINVDDIVWEAIPTATCPAVTDLNENFDTTAVGSLPECWTGLLRGPSQTDIDAIGVSAVGSPSAPNAVNIFKGMSGLQDEQILVLPRVSNLAGGTHKLGFSHAGPPCQIEVGTLSDNTANAVFTLKAAYTVGGWTQTVVDFTDYTGTDNYIGLRLNAGDTPFLSMYIDNVIWSATLGSDGFDNSKFAYYPNPVKGILNLSYDQDITHVAVYNLLGQEIISRKVAANQAQLDLSGLAGGTYIVKVSANQTHKTFKVVKLE